jgi:hypothetical protein
MKKRSNGMLPPNGPRQSQNRESVQLEDAILMAAEAVGHPGEGGTGGLVGYLTWAAKHHPRPFARLLGEVLTPENDEHGRS